MTAGEFQRLESEVERARSRVVRDLDRLRSPTNIAQLKRDLGAELRHAKDEAVEKTKEIAADKARDMVSDIKARIAANPAAVLALSAGLAWRLRRHPPIASTLVGLGLVGLLRSDPARPGPGSRLTAGASEFAHSAKETVGDWLSSETAERIGEAAEDAGEQVGAWGAEAAQAARRGASEGLRTARHLRDRGVQISAAAADRLSDAVSDPAQRDKYLLGAAALALAAAVGIASQRH